MDKVVQTVKLLLRSAVNDGGKIQGAQQWQLLLGVCAAQNIHTLVYDYLPPDVPESIRSVWKSQLEITQAQNKRISIVSAMQEKAWQTLGLKYALLKGESIAALYPHPENRGSGDIDWYFATKDSWEKARQAAQKNVPEGIHQDSDGDFNYTFNNVVVEHHKDWTHLSSRRLRRKAGAPSIENGRLSPDYTLLMLECHILHHCVGYGLGLKQFADLAVALKYYNGKYSKESFAARMKSLGLTRWSSLLHATVLDLTGIDPEVLPIPASSDSIHVNTLVNLILADGSIAHKRKKGFGLVISKALLFWQYSKIELIARSFHLATGKLKKLLHIK